MNRLLLLAAGRFYLRHPWQLALAILGIALGVAVYVGVDLANASAERAFQLSTEVVRGQTTHRLLPVGGSMDESVYRNIVAHAAATRAAPVVEATLRIGNEDGPRHLLLGIDPIEEAGLRDYTSASGVDGGTPAVAGGSGLGSVRLLTEADSVLLPASLAERYALGVGDDLEVWLNGRIAALHVVGIISAPAGMDGGEPPLVADIATAQELAGRIGRLDRIDLGLSAEQADRLRQAPPPGTALVIAGSEDASLNAMMQAFSTNLAAMGLLALAVGMFLIYSTVSFAVVQRRPTIAVLRAVGVDRHQLLAGFLLEAAALGVMGTLCGLILGHWLASQLLGMVLRTIGDLYFSAAVGAASPSAWISVQGAMLGLGATLIAALGPATAAAREGSDEAFSRAALERRVRRTSRMAAWTSAPVILVALILLLADRNSLVLAFAAMSLLLCAGAMLTPTITLLLARGLEKPASALFGFPGLLAVRGVGASLSRTAVAAAALAVAVATVVGVGLMIDSFRGSLVAWLGDTLTADLYVSLGDSDGVDLDASVLQTLLEIPGVAGLSQARVVRLPSSFGDIGLRAAAPGPEGWGLQIVAGDMQPLETPGLGGEIAISEPLAYRLDIGAGDQLNLPTPDGPRTFNVAAIYRDFNSGGSGIVMPLPAYSEYWRDGKLTGLGIHVLDPDNGNAVSAAVEAVFGKMPDPPAGFSIRSTSAIQDITMRIFDRTFQITEVLRILAGFIAFLGVLSAMLAIQLERGRELAILRGLGFGPRSLGVQVLAQTGVLGLCAGIAALPLGTALSVLLVHVINRRSFGWTMELELSFAPMGLGLALAVSAALLAGVYPAWRSSRAGLEAALRDE